MIPHLHLAVGPVVYKNLVGSRFFVRERGNVHNNITILHFLKNHHITLALLLFLAATVSPSGLAIPAIANSVLDPAAQEVLSITQASVPRVAQSLATIAANGVRDGPPICDDRK